MRLSVQKLIGLMRAKSRHPVVGISGQCLYSQL
jgi:hypothetical protein